MKIKGYTHLPAEVRVLATIDDGPVLPMSYGRAGGRYRVDEIKAMWSLGWHGQWDAQFVFLHGPRIKKDGTEGVNDHQRTLSRYDLIALVAGEPVAVERWGWLLPVLEALRPQALVAASTDQEGQG